ncbi:hypothetical protein ANO11243_000280 [Dothideomycetidae sp. 11243]|nr:hypothetical protein ANO11243_000280 [fungal sp. No.11243]
MVEHNPAEAKCWPRILLRNPSAVGSAIPCANALRQQQEHRQSYGQAGLQRGKRNVASKKSIDERGTQPRPNFQAAGPEEDQKEPEQFRLDLELSKVEISGTGRGGDAGTRTDARWVPGGARTGARTGTRGWQPGRAKRCERR